MRPPGRSTDRRRRPAITTAALALLVLAACGQGAGAPAAVQGRPAAPPAQGPLVVFLGDSITAGLHLPSAEAFPSLLERMLADAGRPVRVRNAGVSGDTTAGGLRRVDWLLEQGPDLLVVELGANDGLRGVPLAEIEENLRGIVGRALENGTDVLLLGMHLPANYGKEYTAGFEALYERVSRDLGVPLVPRLLEGVAGVPELNFPDGIHPRAEGHERLAERLLPVLRGQLAE